MLRHICGQYGLHWHVQVQNRARGKCLNIPAFHMFNRKVILCSVMNLYKRNACWIVVEKPEVKGPLGRSKHKLEDNINMDNEESWEPFFFFFLGFPMSRSKCWDGSQDSNLPLHASYVALPT